MEYRTFGRLGWQVSVIGLGAAWLGYDPQGRKSPDEFAQVVQRALAAGINYIDTARYYGRSEEILGEVLDGVKQPFYLATKAGLERDGAASFTREAILRSFETSLRLLRRDRVDLLQLHEVNTAPPEIITGAGGALEALRQLQEEGCVTGIGITGRNPELLAQLVKTEEFDSVLSYCDYDLTTRLARDVLIPVARQRNVAVVLGSPLRCGRLTPAGISRLQEDSAVTQKKIHRLLELFDQVGEPLHHAALRYLWGDRDVATVLSGVASVEEVEDVLRAYEKGPLGEEELALIAEIQSLPD